MNKTEVKNTESKYAKKLKIRRRLCYQLRLAGNTKITRILTWPELLALGVNKS